MESTEQFTKEEIERYSRQILLHGRSGQSKLKQAKALVIGCGGLASGLCPSLASSGVGHISLYDDDVIERSNLARQNIFSTGEIGLKKGAALIDRMREINPHITIDWVDAKFNGKEITAIESVDLIIDGSDDIENKFRVNDLCVQNQKALIIGGLGPTQGHVFPIASNQAEFACYRCLFEKPPETEVPTCATEGVMGPLPSIMGSMMAYLACDFFLKDKNLPLKLYTFENSSWRTLPLKKRLDCKHRES